MSILSALAAQSATPSAQGATAQRSGAQGALAPRALIGTPARGGHAVVDPVSLSDTGIRLSQGLAGRADQLGIDTVDAAEKFLTQFASSLFGGTAKGASITFDSASVESSVTFSGGRARSVGPNGSTDSAALHFAESAHFIGSGKITTADGQQFDFEIEVKYDASVAASSSRSVSTAPNLASAGTRAGQAPTGTSDIAPTPGQRRPLPDIDFPGTLKDLFKLLGRTLQGEQPPGEAKDNDGGGTLTLRLLKLVNSAVAPSDAVAAGNDAQARSSARASALANTYGIAPVPSPTDTAASLSSTAPSAASEPADVSA